MHPFIARKIFYFPIQDLRGQHILKYFNASISNQFLRSDILKELIDHKIVSFVNSLRNVPYYSNLFKKIKVDFSDITGYSDLIKFPLLSKDLIIEHEIELINPKYKDKLFLRKTGGSTGLPLHFYKDGDALAKNDAVMWRCYSWYGIKPGDRQVRFWGVPVTHNKKRTEQIKDFLCNRIRISAFDISRAVCLREWERIKKFKPAYFYGYTTAIYGFVRELHEAGIDINQLPLKAVICTAEKMYDHHRKLFKSVFSCPVVDEYGSTENGIIAFQCKNGNMHLMSDHLGIEFVDENNNRVGPEKPGYIIITDFNSFGMPLLRYNIGDIGQYSNNQCDCGVSLPIMNIIEGRKEDFIRTIDGKLIHAAFLCYTLKEDFVHEFKMIQKAINTYEVQIVKAPSWNNNSENLLRFNLSSSLGNNTNILFVYLPRIPREKSGKLRYFISEL